MCAPTCSCQISHGPRRPHRGARLTQRSWSHPPVAANEFSGGVRRQETGPGSLSSDCLQTMRPAAVRTSLWDGETLGRGWLRGFRSRDWRVSGAEVPLRCGRSWTSTCMILPPSEWVLGLLLQMFKLLRLTKVFFYLIYVFILMVDNNNWTFCFSHV